jgi:hypothetical protein
MFCTHDQRFLELVKKSSGKRGQPIIVLRDVFERAARQVLVNWNLVRCGGQSEERPGDEEQGGQDSATV